MSLQELKEASKQEGEAAREAVAPFVAKLNQIIASNFGAPVSTIHEAYSAALVKADRVPTANESLTRLLPTVMEQLSTSVNLLLALHRFIMVHVPVIEDGGNFGVGVQQEVAKLISESIKKIEASFEKLPEYHEKRAAAWEKLAVKRETVTKSSKSQSSATGGKDGDENKTSTSSSEDSTTTAGLQVPDALAAVAAADVRAYVQMHGALQVARDNVLFCADMVELNIAKLRAPKGDSSGARPGFMF